MDNNAIRNYETTPHWLSSYENTTHTPHYKGNENLHQPSSDATFLFPPHCTQRDSLSNNKHSHKNNTNHPDRNGKTTSSISSLTTRLGRRTSTSSTRRPTRRRSRCRTFASCPRFTSPYKRVNVRTWGVEGRRRGVYLWRRCLWCWHRRRWWRYRRRRWRHQIHLVRLEWWWSLRIERGYPLSKHYRAYWIGLDSRYYLSTLTFKGWYPLGRTLEKVKEPVEVLTAR